MSYLFSGTYRNIAKCRNNQCHQHKRGCHEEEGVIDCIGLGDGKYDELVKQINFPENLIRSCFPLAARQKILRDQNQNCSGDRSDENHQTSSLTLEEKAEPRPANHDVSAGVQRRHSYLFNAMSITRRLDSVQPIKAKVDTAFTVG